MILIGTRKMGLTFSIFVEKVRVENQQKLLLSSNWLNNSKEWSLYLNIDFMVKASPEKIGLSRV